ncbi:GlcG protein [Robbsia andropogonis]|uniref:GlcG protein n=1 Tax=Robbsia andropogonis TaxID=28092 RepID=A0A0F5K4X6_9BURK|nr:heme-binding protein [Robbsia andropogonis]KKB65138.1 GlcG protein [Robbsia andropogonis]MCP1121085.1 heme-binding protein [Robbsia andropogonis]MCP1130915.1 heme-binding protein [Robbsia andropogonis]
MPALTLTLASKITDAAIAAARMQKFAPMAVVVVDAAGHVVTLQREDGATMIRVDIALGKAWTSAAMSVPTRDLVGRAKDNPGFFNALMATGKGKFIPQTGAVLIKDGDGAIIGAVGASGGTGDQDEQICLTALAEVLDGAH